MTGARPIGVGLAGFGVAGAILHAPVIEALPDYRIAAVMTSRPAAAALRDMPRIVPDIATLVTDADVDLVVVVTPNDRHFDDASAALAAGKHVLLDKPMVPSVAGCDALIAQAEAAGLMLSAYHNRRWDGDFVAARKAVAERSLGRLSLYEARWDRFRPQAPEAWRNAPRAGSGLLWDLGPHLLDQAVQLFGWPDAMHADIATQRERALADDYFELTLQYGTMRAILSASTLVAGTRPRFALHGDKGSWWTEGIDPLEAALRAGGNPSVAGFAASLPPIPAFRAAQDGERTADPVPAGDLFGFYAMLAMALRGEAPAPVDPRDARDIVALIEAAHEGAPLPARSA